MDNPYQDLAPRAAIEIMKGKLLDMAKNILADAMDDPMAGAGGQPRLKIAAGFRAAGGKEIKQRNEDHRADISVGDQIIDDDLREDGPQKPQRGGEDAEDQSADEVFNISFNIGKTFKEQACVCSFADF